jgi:hypothetical protein
VLRATSDATRAANPTNRKASPTWSRQAGSLDPGLRACAGKVEAHAPSHMPPAANTLNTIPRWLILMGLLTAIGPLAIDMYLPAFPAIVEGLGTTQGEVERTLASYLLGLAFAQVFYGPLADRYGRSRRSCWAWRST